MVAQKLHYYARSVTLFRQHNVNDDDYDNDDDDDNDVHNDDNDDTCNYF